MGIPPEQGTLAGLQRSCRTRILCLVEWVILMMMSWNKSGSCKRIWGVRAPEEERLGAWLPQVLGVPWRGSGAWELSWTFGRPRAGCHSQNFGTAQVTRSRCRNWRWREGLPCARARVCVCVGGGLWQCWVWLDFAGWVVLKRGPKGPEVAVRRYGGWLG